MLGRPKIIAPVLIMICPGAWLNASVDMPLITAMSSTTFAEVGQQLGELGPATGHAGRT